MLAEAPLLAHVKVLSLRANDITDHGARALAASPFATNLRAINLDKTRVTAAGKQALMDAMDRVTGDDRGN
jgi:Ran GTPase-activating protein (RanGAP) involved in mRNA processing and transport